MINTAKLFEFKFLSKMLINDLGELAHRLAGRPLVLSAVEDIEKAQVNLTFLKDNAELWGLDELIEVKTLCAAINEATSRFIEQEVTLDNATREKTQ